MISPTENGTREWHCTCSNTNNNSNRRRCIDRLDCSHGVVGVGQEEEEEEEEEAVQAMRVRIVDFRAKYKHCCWMDLRI